MDIPIDQSWFGHARLLFTRFYLFIYSTVFNCIMDWAFISFLILWDYHNNDNDNDNDPTFK